MTAKESIRMGQSTGKLSRESSSIDMNSSNVRSRREADSVERVYPDEEFPLPDTPDDILFEILQWVPAEDIVKSCVYVCKQWKGVIDTQMFWKEKCIKDLGYTNEMFHFLTDEDCKLLYFKRPYQNNLIKNPVAKEGFKYWTIHANGGDQWKAESPVGCDPVENFTNNQLLSGETRCWVTSFGVCSKSQTIDLVDRGCSSHILDEVRPHIHLTEWYAARFDCGIIYKLNVQLLKSLNDEKPIKEWIFEDTKPAGREWFKADHIMSDYEPGVRFIRFYHEGKDTQFWAGWYGAKMTLSTVIIDLKKVKQ